MMNLLNKSKSEGYYMTNYTLTLAYFNQTKFYLTQIYFLQGLIPPNLKTIVFVQLNKSSNSVFPTQSSRSILGVNLIITTSVKILHLLFFRSSNNSCAFCF